MNENISVYPLFLAKFNLLLLEISQILTFHEIILPERSDYIFGHKRNVKWINICYIERLTKNDIGKKRKKYNKKQEEVNRIVKRDI